MGLAASQARFLGLTARKSNVEFRGQQINQARTALSNEVMGLFDKYSNLEVPVPPVVSDYQKTTYTLDSTYEGYKIQNFSRITQGEYEGYYDVVLSWEDEIAKAYTYTSRDSVITAQKGANGYSYLNFKLGLDEYTYKEGDEKNSTITKIDGDYEKHQGLTTIMQAQGLTSGTFYMYLKEGVAYYTSEDDLNSTAYEDVDGKNVYYGAYTFDYQGAQRKSNTANAVAALTQESSGRLSTIQIMQSDDVPEMTGNTYSITTGTSEDSMAYEQAMNEYQYQKDLYEKEVETINSKTKKIQEQDRTLELELSQLDTEQQAISTEMESISKVIEETMDKVFKTFNG